LTVTACHRDFAMIVSIFPNTALFQLTEEDFMNQFVRILMSAFLLLATSSSWGQTVTLNVTNDVSNVFSFGVTIGSTPLTNTSGAATLNGEIVANVFAPAGTIESFEIVSSRIRLSDITLSGTALGFFPVQYSFLNAAFEVVPATRSVTAGIFSTVGLGYDFNEGTIRATVGPAFGVPATVTNIPLTDFPVFVSPSTSPPGGMSVVGSNVSFALPLRGAFTEADPTFGTIGLSFSGFVGTQGALPPVLTPGSVDVDFASPTDVAYISGNRPLPDVNSTFKSLDVLPGSTGTLAPNQTITLTEGPLVIAEGATFIGNGTINGSVLNKGLLIIPIVKVPTVNDIVPPTGGDTGTTILTIPEAPPVGPRDPIVLTPPSGGTGEPLSFGSGGGYFFSSAPPPGPSGPTPPVVIICDWPDVEVGGTLGTRYDADLRITGTYTQTETAALRLFVAGEEQGVSYSLLSIGEAAALAGELQIVLQPELFDYFPEFGDSYDMILATGGITIADSGLNIRSFVTAGGADYLRSRGYTLNSFNSGYAGDPNQLFLIEGGFFSYELVENGTVLRVTAVPEVSSLAISSLIFSGAGLLALRSRRARDV
jgi:hypothetical protein